MKNLFATLVLIVALLSFGAFSPGVSAQTLPVADNVSVQVGVVHQDLNSAFSDGNLLAGKFEVQKTLTEKLSFDNTFTVTDNAGSGSGQLLSNQSLLRGYLGDTFFVAGGATVSKLVNVNVNTSTFLNPSVQAGLTLPVTGTKFTFEPYIELNTPDLLNSGSNKARSLTANLTTSVALNSKAGLKFDVGITQVRFDNSFLRSGGQNSPYAYGGVYFNFGK